MKKVLLFSLGLILGFSTFAQQRIPKSDVQMATACYKEAAIGKEVSIDNVPFVPQSAKSVVVNGYDDMDVAEPMWTTYDLQSNQYVANRMYQMPNGSVNIVATMSHQYNQTASDRGTGYNYYNGSYWQNQPNARVESFKAGWPTIAQWGSSGEILISHGNGGLQCYTRSTAGQGSWTFKSTLPLYPSGYPYQGESDAYPTWARVVTSGNNHNIIHVVAAIQHTISSDETDVRTVLFRSEDAVNWTISYGPLQGYGYHINEFSADDYALAANGHNVAILYSGSLHNSVWMFKSSNDGLTWNGRRVWQDPYEGQSFNTVIYSDTLYRPMNGAVVIDNNGVVHVALNTFEMIRTSENDPGYYTSWYGRAVDGILYWNDTQEGPIADTYHEEYVGTIYEEHFANPNPFHAARLWWPNPDEPGYVHMLPDATKWIGFIPMYDDYFWENEKFYHSGTEYMSKFYGASGHPALSCDPQGNLACAFSSPCVKRDNGYCYYRSIYVSYRSASEGYWRQNEDDITNPDNSFIFLDSENIFTNAVCNTTNSGEFWFGFQSDSEIGLYWGSGASQTNASENTIYAVKVTYDFGITNYTITATANPTNGGTVTGGGTYAQGSTCTLHATANSGYSFVKWTKNGTQVSTNPNYSFTVTGNASYVAHFQQSTSNYTITATASPSNAGTITGAGSYASGSTCTLCATPNSGYTFVNWLQNGTVVSTNATYSFTVTGNRTLIAVFDIATSYYNISATAEPSNGGSVSGAGSYAQGNTCTLVATANSGYSFVKWTKNGTQVSTNPTYSFTVTGNATYVAHFEQNIVNYAISATAEPSNGGSVSGAGSYAQGNTCTLVATANSGYSFVKWTKNGTQVSTNPTYSFTVTGNATYVAHFEQNIVNYAISATAEPSNGGSVSGAGSYAQGNTCTLVATANSGYSFVKWTKNGTQVSTDPTYSFTVTGNAAYVAHFERNSVECTIVVNADPANGGVVSGGGTYTEGTTCVISAIPNSGYVFEKWTLNGVEVATNPTYTFVVAGNATYVGHFRQSADYVTITAMADPVEGGAVTGGGTYELGDNCTLNAIAAVGYEFVNWTLNGSQVSTETTFSFSVTSNALYVAHFSRIVNHYTVTVSLEPSSSGSVIGAGSYEEGAVCTLIAVANPTYTFVSWTENGTVVSTDDHYMFTVNRNRDFVAVFSQGLFYTISASAGANGSISPEGDVLVEPGEDKTFAMIPNSGCSVLKVVVDGMDVGPVESYTFRSVNGNHSIHVQFSGLGVDDAYDLGLNVYPNPAKDKVAVDCPNMKRLCIFNLFGVQIDSADVDGDHTVVNTSKFPQGTYILKMENNDGRIGYTRFVVVK